MKTSQSFGVHFTIKKERAKDGVTTCPKFVCFDAIFNFINFLSAKLSVEFFRNFEPDQDAPRLNPIVSL